MLGLFLYAPAPCPFLPNDCQIPTRYCALLHQLQNTAFLFAHLAHKCWQLRPVSITIPLMERTNTHSSQQAPAQ